MSLINKEKHIAEYHKLLPLQKTAVQIMVVNVDYCKIKTILNCLNDMGFRQENGSNLNINTIQPMQKELISKGLLLKSTKGITCPESIIKQVLHDILQNNRFGTIAATLKQYISLPNTGMHDNPFENYQQLIRSFQIALFTQSSMDELELIENHYAYHHFKGDYFKNNPYLSLLTEPFSRKIMDKISPRIRIKIALILVARNNMVLGDATKILRYIIDSFDSGVISGTHGIIHIIIHLILRGEKNHAHLFIENLEKHMKPEQLSCMAWSAAISKDYKKANMLFEQAIEYLNKIFGKQNVILQGYAGMLYPISLFLDAQSNSLKKAVKHIELFIKHKNRELTQPITPQAQQSTEYGGHLASYRDFHIMAMHLSYFKNMKIVCENKLGLQSYEQHESGVQFFRDEQDPLCFFLNNLSLAWINAKEAKKNIVKIANIRDKAQKNNYNWLAAELSALLSLLGKEKEKNHKLSEELHNLCRTTSFVRLVKIIPQWEQTLNGLLHIAKPDNKTRTEHISEKRLIWLINHNEQYNYCSITPRLQILNKKGTWSKGRAVALKNLYYNHKSMEGLTKQDHQICQSIEEEYFRTGYRYSRVEYSINEDEALPALVGHPFLFLENSPQVGVEFVSGEPEIRLIKTKTGFKLAVFPDQNNSEVVLVKDTPTRFKVIRCSNEQTQLMEYLGKGLTIPKSGKDLAGKVVQSLSSIITVHSDLEPLENTKIKKINADFAPHVHIIPYQEDGISLEFLVKPCGAEGSSFIPGKGAKNVLTEVQGETLQAVRDLKKEKQQCEKIIKICSTLSHFEKIDNQWQVDNPEDSLELLLELKECPDDVIIEWPQGEKFKVTKRVSFDNLSMQIKQDRDWFKATGSLKIDDATSLDLKELLNKISCAKGNFIPLDDTTFLRITEQLRKRLEELDSFSQPHGQGVRFAPLAALALEDLTEETRQLKTDKAWKEHCKQIKQVASPKIPSTFQGVLRDYQNTGFLWLAQLSAWGVGACLADDMGLGKTIQALTAILLRSSNGPSLVAAPLSVTSNWQDEVMRFAPTLNVIVFGPGDRQETIKNLQAFDLLIVSYGLLPIETKLLSSVKWQTVILDEAQAIKNMQTKRSKAAMDLQAHFRIITTGTPIENHLAELWTLFNFLNPGLLGSYKKFNEKFAIPIERDQNNEVRNRLRKLIRPFILRRLKRDVLQELPPKTEITLEVEMSNEEALLYEAQRLKSLENINESLGDNEGQKHLRILGEIMKLRRLCCNPKLILPDCKIASSKLKVFGDTLNELLSSNHKVLVFSQFVGHLEIIRNYLEDQGISYQYLTGSTPIKKRKQCISDFQNGTGDVFLISLKAGGAGLNLTAADYVIHMDPWWNPAVEDQASDRAHRIGQKRPVTVYRMVVKDSIENQIINLHKQKRDLAESLLKGTDAAGKVSTKELLGFLQKN